MTINDFLTTIETFDNVTYDNTSEITTFTTNTVIFMSSTTTIEETKISNGNLFYFTLFDAFFHISKIILKKGCT